VIVRLVLFGRQGAGKGTQSTLLAKHFDAPHISTGDMLREAAADGTDVGRRVKDLIGQGLLIPDDTMLDVISERFAHDDVVQHGFLLDGFPRTLVQAKALHELSPVDVAINLDVPEDIVLERLSSRRVCSDCGRTYSLAVPPSHRWVCDTCGGRVVQREDDTPEAIAKRLATYTRETEPAIDYFAKLGLLVTVDGLGSPDDVARRLITAIDGRLVR